jgi:hypothetical protein
MFVDERAINTNSRNKRIKRSRSSSSKSPPLRKKKIDNNSDHDGAKEFTTRYGHIGDYIVSQQQCNYAANGTAVGLKVLREFLPTPHEWYPRLSARDSIMLTHEEAQTIEREEIEDSANARATAVDARISHSPTKSREHKAGSKARCQKSSDIGSPRATINLDIMIRLKAAYIKHFSLKTGRLKRYDTTSGFFVEVSYKTLLSGSFGFLFVHPDLKERSWQYLGPRTCIAVSGGGKLNHSHRSSNNADANRSPKK